MTFLQPYLLFALPLIALPILIHLINQNRHKTIHWAATMFLLQAKRMARGMARLRYLLILLMRMLALAGLIFAVSRPMSGGWLGFTAGSTPDTTIIVLDRSASMEEQGPGSAASKRETALQKLTDLISTTGRNTQLVLFESTQQSAKVIDSAQELLDLPETGPSATAADIPALLEQVTEYIISNETGRTDVWICSDLRQSDWNPTGGRWQTLRKQLADREGTHLYLLNYASIAEENLAIRVSGVHRRESSAGAELVMDLRITRYGSRTEPLVIPVNIVINGARSILEVEMTSNEMIQNGHTIPIASESKHGWGRVELPSDANLADNVYRFVYAEPAARKTVVVSDDKETARILELVAATGADKSLTYQTEVFSSSSAAALPWNETGLILWHAPLPTGVLAEQVQAYLRTGRSIMFFPPESPTEESFLELNWGTWQDQPLEPLSIQRWRTDSGLLANTLSGEPLPVGELEVSRYCSLQHPESTILAQFANGSPLLASVTLEQGGAYFCSTLPTLPASNFAQNGIVLYVMIHRALARGAATLGLARQYNAGELSVEQSSSWQPLDDLSTDQLLSQRTINSGLYSDKQGVLLALNRPATEDLPEVVRDEVLEVTLNGLNYTQIKDEAGSTMALASEVWRTFLIVMIAALLLEAVLCLPDRQSIPNANAPRTVATAS